MVGAVEVCDECPLIVKARRAACVFGEDGVVGQRRSVETGAPVATVGALDVVQEIAVQRLGFCGGLDYRPANRDMNRLSRSMRSNTTG